MKHCYACENRILHPGKQQAACYGCYDREKSEATRFAPASETRSRRMFTDGDGQEVEVASCATGGCGL